MRLTDALYTSQLGSRDENHWTSPQRGASTIGTRRSLASPSGYRGCGRTGASAP